MPTVWDAARTLLATAGSEADAKTAALEMAASCRRSRAFAEAGFWDEVAVAIAYECNPQPMIAPDTGRDAGRPARHRHTTSARTLQLPRHRSTVLRFQKDLRDLWKRYETLRERTKRSSDEPDK